MSTTSNATEKIEQHRDALEELADSDLPCADMAANLLEVSDA
jgi:hypothetical protein